MALQKPLPDVINDFVVISDLGTKFQNGKKRRLACFLCPICKSSFVSLVDLIKRKGRISCSRSCKNKHWIENLNEYNGFKIIKTFSVQKGKRPVVAQCPFCLKNFNSTLQSLLKTTQCGCLEFTKGYPKRLIRIRNNMIQRCHNPKNTNYNRYGKRGIFVCQEWREPNDSFFIWSLKNGYDEQLSIDRIDNDGPYYPKNCRWATRKMQMANTRTTKRVHKDT